MKRTLIIVALVAIALNINAQSELSPDQNPDYHNSLNKYKDSADEYSVLQGTTKQQTYQAIDPMEEKRKLKALRRQYRANRPLWRHERRLKRIENTRFYETFPGYYGDYIGGRYGRNYGSNWLNFDTLLGMGLLGCYLFD